MLGTGETRLHQTPPAAAPARQPDPVAQPPTPAAQPLAAQPAPTPLPAPTTLPAPPVVPAAPQPVAARPGAASGRQLHPLALIGGGLLVVATFLPWITGGGISVDALDVPIESLWSLSAGDGPIKVGFLTLLLGGAGAGLSLLPRTAWIRRLCGSIGAAVVLAFAVQLFRSIDQAGGSGGDLFSAIGIGVYVALAGALALQFSK